MMLYVDQEIKNRLQILNSLQRAGLYAGWELVFRLPDNRC